jgi:hypothetical protein
MKIINQAWGNDMHKKLKGIKYNDQSWETYDNPDLSEENWTISLVITHQDKAP